jgi:hypothetical protein
MSAITDFIGELIRDANSVARLNAYQKRNILERAVSTIHHLRQTIGIPKGPGRDVALDIHTTALSLELGWRDDAQICDAMLTAAGMIRDLHIILDSETKIDVVWEASSK